MNTNFCMITLYKYDLIKFQNKLCPFFVFAATTGSHPGVRYRRTTHGNGVTDSWTWGSHRNPGLTRECLWTAGVLPPRLDGCQHTARTWPRFTRLQHRQSVLRSAKSRTFRGHQQQPWTAIFETSMQHTINCNTHTKRERERERERELFSGCIHRMR